MARVVEVVCKRNRSAEPNLMLMGRLNDSDRRSLVREYQASGLLQRDFCDQKGISERTLRSWLAKHAAPKLDHRSVRAHLLRLRAEIDGLIAAIDAGGDSADAGNASEAGTPAAPERLPRTCLGHNHHPEPERIAPESQPAAEASATATPEPSRNPSPHPPKRPEPIQALQKVVPEKPGPILKKLGPPRPLNVEVRKHSMPPEAQHSMPPAPRPRRHGGFWDAIDDLDLKALDTA